MMDLRTFGRNIGEVLADRSLQLIRSTSMDDVQRAMRGQAPANHWMASSGMASIAVGLGVFTLGAAVGAGLTALYTPTTGRDLRKKLGRGARDARKQANELGSDVRHRFDDARAELEQMSSGHRRTAKASARRKLNGASTRPKSKRSTAASAEA